MIVEMLREMMRAGASDLHLTAGAPPTARIHNKLVPGGSGPLTHQQVTALVQELISHSDNQAAHQQILEQRGQVDFSVSISGVGRFRVNAYRQRGNLAAAVRAIPFEVPRFQDLGLPESVRALAERPHGLVLICGATGSGKSTTLAALINEINERYSKHILTIEDPVEYLHRHKRSIVNQREIGSDTLTFAEALRSALRQNPDVIMVGEMRDPETIQIALTAAETGHLVLASLHAHDAASAVDRIIDSYPAEQQKQVALQLSLSLQGVVVQRLLPRADRTGMVCACEVMLPNPAIRNNIKQQQTDQLYQLIQTDSKDKPIHMQTMNFALAEKYAQGLIDADTLWRHMTPEGRQEVEGYLRQLYGMSLPPDSSGALPEPPGRRAVGEPGAGLRHGFRVQQGSF